MKAGARKAWTAAMLLLAADVLCAAEAKLDYFNPQGTEEACFRDGAVTSVTLPGFASGESLRIASVGHAPLTAPAPHQPAIRAESTSGQRWVQIVEIDTAPSSPPARGSVGSQLVDGAFPWVFADTSEGNRTRRIPFYWDEGPTADRRPFFDNPAWGVPLAAEQPDGGRKWEASCFAVCIEGRTITAVSGFRWGYRWGVGKPKPFPLRPAALERSDWQRLSRLLAVHYREWDFR